MDFSEEAVELLLLRWMLILQCIPLCLRKIFTMPWRT